MRNLSLSLSAISLFFSCTTSWLQAEDVKEASVAPKKSERVNLKLLPFPLQLQLSQQNLSLLLERSTKTKCAYEYRPIMMDLLFAN